MSNRILLIAAQVGFVYVHNHCFGYGLHFVVAEDAFHAFVDVGEGSVKIAGLHEVLRCGLFLVAFFVYLYKGYFGQVVFVSCTVIEYFIDFGAFVDIGVHQDGLVHISQICDRFIKHPSEVVAVGAGKVNDRGERIALDVKVGDQVYYGKFGGNDVKVDGEDYLLLRADDIYAVIEG